MADRSVVVSGVDPIVAGVAATSPKPGAQRALSAVIGVGFSPTQTSIGRILNRSARPKERPAIFDARFAASNARWLTIYPLATSRGLRSRHWPILYRKLPCWRKTGRGATCPPQR
jgi:hypothetical protein